MRSEYYREWSEDIYSVDEEVLNKATQETEMKEEKG